MTIRAHIEIFGGEGPCSTRRSFPRVPAQFPIYFLLNGERTPNAFDCRIYTKHPLSPGCSEQDARLAFLYEEDVCQFAKVGMEFIVWDGGDIGRGAITHISSTERVVEGE